MIKKNFTLIGASGYIAPRHMKAIKDTGNNLVATLDPYDGIGIMNSNFPEASFFTEFERFDRFVDKWHRDSNKKIDYMSICSPNYLHDSHIRFALKSGADAICEKPLVLNPWNIDQLKIIEEESGKKVYNILQLRLHDSIIALKERISKDSTSSFAQYSIRIKNRDEIQEKVELQGIPTVIHYPMPLHLQECFEYLGYKKGVFPISEIVSDESMSLPMNPYVRDEEIEYIPERL